MSCRPNDVVGVDVHVDVRVVVIGVDFEWNFLRRNRVDDFDWSPYLFSSLELFD